MPGQSLFVGGPADTDRFLSMQDARLALAGLLANNSADPLDIRLGVLYSGNDTLVTGTAGLSVNVAALHFAASKGSSNGPYLGNNPATANVTVDAAPALGTKRVDVVWVRQQDKGSTVAADASTACAFGTTAGTPTAGTPDKSAIPAGALEVGTITWDSSSTVATATNAAQCTLATTCQWTTTRGNPVPVRDFTERDATIASPYSGMQVQWVGSAGRGFVERYNGSTWVPLHPFREEIRRYTHASTITAGSLAGPFAQTFASGRFTQAPNVVCSVVEGSRLAGYALNVTTSGFDLYLRNNAASDSPGGVDVCVWHAVQMTPNTATG